MRTAIAQRQEPAQVPRAHFDDWDDAVVVAIPAAEQAANAILRRLVALGAEPECWVVSPTTRRDARALPLAEAASTIVGANDGSIVSCVPGVLAFYEGEDLGRRLILHRRTLETDFWAPILWYRDFYDVPRLVCVRVADGLVVLDSRFDGALDEYESTYRVIVIEEETDPDLLIERARVLPPIGVLTAFPDRFDSTLRRAVRLPRRMGEVSLRPFDAR